MSAGDLAAVLREAQEHIAHGQLAQAELAYLEAIRLRADVAEIHFNLGIVYYAQGRFPEALASHRRAFEIKPAFPEAHASAGSALSALGKWDEAAAAFGHAIALRPDYADAHSNLGLVHEEHGRFEAARESFERALALDPGHGEATHNLGFLLEEQGRHGEAMALYARALEKNPGLARTAYNLGLAHLRRQEFAPGWELARARFDTVPPMTPRRALGLPDFSSSDWGRGHRIALWREQGLGDQLLFSTLLPELEALGQDFVVEVDARLAAAFWRAHPNWKIATPEESTAAFASCDRQLAMGSLPQLMRPNLESFKAQPAALLAADPVRAQAFSERLGAGPLIGISWRSFQLRARARVARAKSAPLAAFAGLSRKVHLLDLQYGDTSAERADFARAGGRLERLEDLDLYSDLDGVLAAIEACDRVVTTSNVTAHFAGALGKETLLLHLGAAPFHYWVPGPDGRSLWYPSVRVLAPDGFESWQQALAKVDELAGG
ncbi:MAG: tetratricopeptide repeat protein [Usitatibacter sp.]